MRPPPPPPPRPWPGRPAPHPAAHGHGKAAEILLHAAAALAVSLLLSPLVRTATAQLDGTLGLAWPFSLARCHTTATPGCGDDRAAPAPRLQASR